MIVDLAVAEVGQGAGDREGLSQQVARRGEFHAARSERPGLLEHGDRQQLVRQQRDAQEHGARLLPKEPAEVVRFDGEPEAARVTVHGRLVASERPESAARPSGEVVRELLHDEDPVARGQRPAQRRRQVVVHESIDRGVNRLRPRRRRCLAGCGKGLAEYVGLAGLRKVRQHPRDVVDQRRGGAVGRLELGEGAPAGARRGARRTRRARPRSAAQTSSRGRETPRPGHRRRGAGGRGGGRPRRLWRMRDPRGSRPWRRGGPRARRAARCGRARPLGRGDRGRRAGRRRHRSARRGSPRPAWSLAAHGPVRGWPGHRGPAAPRPRTGRGSPCGCRAPRAAAPRRGRAPRAGPSSAHGGSACG